MLDVFKSSTRARPPDIGSIGGPDTLAPLLGALDHQGDIPVA